MTFSPATDDLTATEVKIFQGERELVRDNRLLGNNFIGAPCLNGVPRIDITFDIDIAGIVRVTAKDKATNYSAAITSGPSNEDLESMVLDAEWHDDANKVEIGRVCINSTSLLFAIQCTTQTISFVPLEQPSFCSC